MFTAATTNRGAKINGHVAAFGGGSGTAIQDTSVQNDRRPHTGADRDIEDGIVS